MAESMGIVVVFVIFTTFFSYYAAKRLRLYYLLAKFDGPHAMPILGNSHRRPRSHKEATIQGQGVMNAYRKTTGGLMRAWYGPAPVIIIYGAKHVETILSSTRHLKKGYWYKFLEPWLGKGLLTSTGEKWFHRRKLLTPTFHFSILQNFMEVFNEQSFILVRKLETYAHHPEAINIFPHVTNCVLDIICDTAMGKHINAQGDKGNNYVKAVQRMSSLLSQRGRQPWLWPDAIFQRTEIGEEQSRHIGILHDVTNKMIQERLRDSPKCVTDGKGHSNVGGKRQRIAFLDLLLQMHREDDNFTLRDIREEVDTFMFEGHDTTAAAVSWALFQIGLNQNIQARLHKEIDSTLGDSDRPVTSDDLSNMPYLNRVVKEALRRVPSVPLVLRSLEEDIVLDGKVLPKEVMVMLNIYALHQDPEYFPEPERFDPDRFLPENIAKRHPYAYVPFSAGPRNCIGQKFALMEDKVILVNILRKFSLESVQTMDEAQPTGTLIMRPADGELLLKFKTRNTTAEP